MYPCEQVAHGNKTLVSRIEFSQLSREVPTRTPDMGAIWGGYTREHPGKHLTPTSLLASVFPPRQGCHGPLGLGPTPRWAALVSWRLPSSAGFGLSCALGWLPWPPRGTWNRQVVRQLGAPGPDGTPPNLI